MKYILLLTVLITVSTVNLIYAQDYFSQYKEKSENKGDKCNYVILASGNVNLIYNKSNKLMIDKSDFLTKMEGTLYNEHDFVKFDRTIIDSAVIKRIAPFYRNYNTKYTDKGIGTFSMLLYAKPDGKVCELAFEYNRDANIPIQAIEKLENEILSMDLTLDFDRNSYYTKSAIWVWFGVDYSIVRQFKKYLQSGDQ